MLLNNDICVDLHWFTNTVCYYYNCTVDIEFSGRNKRVLNFYQLVSSYIMSASVFKIPFERS